MAVMLPTVPQIDVLNLLYQQYRLYTTELGRTHEGLGKLYKKLTKLDRKLNELDGQPSSREQRRKISWSRTVAKQSIADLLARQAEIFGLLQQCRDLIASYNLQAYVTPTTPWTTYMPATPYHMQAMSLYPLTPWTAGPFRQLMPGQPQYWDLSMLYDRSSLSPTGSNVASTGPELAMDMHHTAVGDEQFPHHLYCHELMGSAPADLSESAIADEDTLAPDEARNTKPTARAASVIPIDTEKANEIHRRRYSENYAAKSFHRHDGTALHPEQHLVCVPRVDMVRAKTAPVLQLQIPSCNTKH